MLKFDQKESFGDFSLKSWIKEKHQNGLVFVNLGWLAGWVKLSFCRLLPQSERLGNTDLE